MKLAPQGVRRYALGDARQILGGGDSAIELTGGDRIDRVLAGKEPDLRLPRRPPLNARRSSSSCGKASRSDPAALPCSTLSVMRSLSMSDNFRFATSDTLRPAP